MAERFKSEHNESTSEESKKEALDIAARQLRDCSGFILFTVKSDKSTLKFDGCSFIEEEYKLAMPEFIKKILESDRI